MKPVIQTVIGSGENGEVIGNCMRACLATILEIDIDVIPPFETASKEEWFKIFYEWLWKNGYEYKGYGKPEDIYNPEKVIGIDGYIMVGGGSPRDYKRGHAVVFKDGKMVHDPHPSGEGLTDIDGYYIIEKRGKILNMLERNYEVALNALKVIAADQLRIMKLKPEQHGVSTAYHYAVGALSKLGIYDWEDTPLPLMKGVSNQETNIK